MVDHLPRDSAYGEALATDEDLVDLDAKRPEYRPPLQGWDVIAELLAAIHDRLNDVVQVQADKNLNLKQWPRPVTAEDRARDRLRARRRARVRELFKPSEPPEAVRPAADMTRATPVREGLRQDRNGRWRDTRGRYAIEPGRPDERR